MIFTWVLQVFRRWSVEHVKRGANGAAHGLAKHAVNNIADSIWMEEILRCSYQSFLLFLFRVLYALDFYEMKEVYLT